MLCGRALTGLTSAQPLPNLRCRSDLVTDFTVLHYNTQYYFLEPSDEEVVEAYVETYSPEATASDVETDADDTDTDGEEEEEEEEDEEHDEDEDKGEDEDI